MKNKITIIASWFAIVMAMVFFLPIPVRINTTLQGFRLVGTATDTDTEDFASISIKGWYLIYLFRSNEIKGTLAITPYDSEESNNAVYEFIGNTFEPPDNIDIKWSTLIRYSATKNRYTPGTVFFNKNFENVMVTESESSNHIYIAAAKTNNELNDLLNYFEGYIPMDTSDGFWD